MYSHFPNCDAVADPGWGATSVHPPPPPFENPGSAPGMHARHSYSDVYQWRIQGGGGGGGGGRIGRGPPFFWSIGQFFVVDFFDFFCFSPQRSVR